jgi:hypothetical protein
MIIADSGFWVALANPDGYHHQVLSFPCAAWERRLSALAVT